MSHLDAYLGPCPAYGWSGGPQFKTAIDALQNGDEIRNADWIEARHSYAAPFMNIDRDAYREIKRMFLACRGMLHSFRFVDQLDQEAANEQFGTGDGVTDLFQLNKVSEIDGVSYVRNVYAVRVGTTPTITIDGTPTSAFTFNSRTGEVLFDSPPANAAVLRWTGFFDVWARFATDSIPFSLDHPDATNGDVQVIEVPAPDEEISSS